MAFLEGLFGKETADYPRESHKDLPPHPGRDQSTENTQWGPKAGTASLYSHKPHSWIKPARQQGSSVPTWCFCSSATWDKSRCSHSRMNRSDDPSTKRHSLFPSRHPSPWLKQLCHKQIFNKIKKEKKNNNKKKRNRPSEKTADKSQWGQPVRNCELTEEKRNHLGTEWN